MLNESFGHISDYMKQGTVSFKKSTGDFLENFTKTQGDTGTMDSGFKIIEKKFGEFFTITESLRESAKHASENLSSVEVVPKCQILEPPQLTTLPK